MTDRPDDPHDLEGTDDRLEEKVLGHRVDQVRDEDEGPEASDAQTVEPGDGGDPDTGAGAEPA